jgi:hypothetical protein
MRLRTVLLCAIPGAAHVDLGRAGRGLLYFLVFAFMTNAALVAPLAGWEPSVRTGAALAAAGAWILALWDAVRLAARIRREGQAKVMAAQPPPAPQPPAPKETHA